MRSQRLINQSFALLGTPFKVENSCLPMTGGGVDRTKKVKDHTDTNNTLLLINEKKGSTRVVAFGLPLSCRFAISIYLSKTGTVIVSIKVRF